MQMGFWHIPSLILFKLFNRVPHWRHSWNTKKHHGSLPAPSTHRSGIHLSGFFGGHADAQRLYELRRLKRSLRIRTRLNFWIKIIRKNEFIWSWRESWIPSRCSSFSSTAANCKISSTAFVTGLFSVQFIVFYKNFFGYNFFFVSFNAKQIPCPRTSKERQLALAEILIRLHDLDLVIQTTDKHKLEVKKLQILVL